MADRLTARRPGRGLALARRLCGIALLGGGSAGILLLGGCAGETTVVSLNGLALVGAPNHPGSLVGYLGNGTAFNVNQGHTFSYAPLQLPHGAEIKKLTCSVRDNSPAGYLQVHLQTGKWGHSSFPSLTGTVPAGRLLRL
jgi:hypothetical protein